MKNFRKSKKALSPVVASIILIAVTVAVSIAVAAWMGALSFGFMQTEEIRITGLTFPETGKMQVSGANIGTSTVVITSALVNGNPVDVVQEMPLSLGPNAPIAMTLTSEWTAGNNYQVTLISSKGNQWVYNAFAPMA
jgi:archaeal type IV pilus assembly protein PilA